MASTSAPATSGGGLPPPIQVSDLGPHIKNDIYPGSYVQLGTRWQDDIAVRKGRYAPISGDDFSGNSLVVAINKLYQELNVDPHPSAGIPLAYIKAWKNGKKIDFIQVYKRNRLSILPRPAFDAAKFVGAYDHTTVYRAFTTDAPAGDEDGLPTGGLLGTRPLPVNISRSSALPDDSEPRPYQMRIAVVRMIVQTVLGFNPYFGTNSIIHKQGTTNASNVTFSGLEIEANRARFDQATVTPVNGLNNEGDFLVQYQFTLSPFPFKHHELFVGTAEEIGGEGQEVSVPAWDTRNKLTYASVDWNVGDFPVHE